MGIGKLYIFNQVLILYYLYLRVGTYIKIDIDIDYRGKYQIIKIKEISKTVVITKQLSINIYIFHTTYYYYSSEISR